jgi:hypothetical protein
MRSRWYPSALVTAALVTAISVPALAQEPMVEVVADELNNPRGVEVGPDGSVYVAEAGTGGDECATITFAASDQEVCFGPTGAIARIGADGVERVVEGLVSSAAGPEAGGVSDVAVTADGTLYLVMNLGADPAVREGAPEALATSGWLLKVGADGALEPVADIAQFEADHDPDAEFGGEVDSNPYGIIATEDGIAVADAGGNDVLLVGDDGSISFVVGLLPITLELSAEEAAAMGMLPEGEGEAPAEGSISMPMQAVPTSLALGPDGALYVGQLTGAPFPVGGASVWRVVPGEDPTEYATGFSSIMGLGFGPDGTLYVAEMVHDGLMSLFAGGEDGPPPLGAVMSVAPGGGEPTLVATGEQLMALGGLAVDADGAIYVSTGTIMGPGAGTVVKITP